MDLMMRRNALLACGKEEELYPVGTDIITKYIGRDANGNGLFDLVRKCISTETGEIGTHNGQSASDTYIPVKGGYKFKKTAPQGRSLFNIAFYDSQYAFISGWTSGGDWGEINLPIVPNNAMYMRVSANTAYKKAEIIRISWKGDTK